MRELLKHPDIEIEFQSAQLKKTPLHIAAEMDQVEILKLLIEAGSDPNSRDFDESTSLHCASEQGSLKCLQYLLANTNADPCAKNKFGYTPSDIAQNLIVRQTFEKQPEV